MPETTVKLSAPRRTASVFASLAMAVLLPLSLVSQPGRQPEKTVAQDKNAPSDHADATAPRPPLILLQQGRLTVEANDGDLAQILRAITAQTGMQVEGSPPAARVYGTFGPEAPSAVLTDLLKGLGYNVVMTGSTRNGMPAKLELSLRTGAATPPAASVVAASEPAGKATAAVANSRASEFGPGAMEHVRPAQSDDPQTRAQQNMRRLQQMHQTQTAAPPNLNP